MSDVVPVVKAICNDAQVKDRQLCPMNRAPCMLSECAVYAEVSEKLTYKSTGQGVCGLIGGGIRVLSD